MKRRHMAGRPVRRAGTGFILLLGLLLSGLLFLDALHAGQIPAVDEGWIQSNKESAAETASTNTRAYSLEKPVRLVTGKNNKSVRAVYLKFDLSALPADAKGVELVLTFFESEERANRRQNLRSGTYVVHGLADGAWDSATLTASDAPGWSVPNNGTGGEAAPLTEFLLPEGDSDECRFPSSSEFEAFLEKNKGRLITLIITKKGNSGAGFVPGRTDIEKGPRLEFEP